MPSPRFHKLSQEKQQNILQAAGREFAEHGYDGATINLILEHAGLSTGAAYYYFHNKADLFAEVVRFYVDLLLDNDFEIRATDPDTFWLELVELARPVFAESNEVHRVFGGLKAAWKHSSQARDIDGLAEQFARQEDILRRLVGQARQVGALRQDLPEDLVVCLLQAIDEGFDNYLQLQSPGWQPTELMPLLMELLLGVKQLLQEKEPS